jgi:hypothetical protein
MILKTLIEPVCHILEDSKEEPVVKARLLRSGNTSQLLAQVLGVLLSALQPAAPSQVCFMSPDEWIITILLHRAFEIHSQMLHMYGCMTVVDNMHW